MQRKAIFIAATGQNVGKTTICLGLIAGLRKTFSRLGFMKPVGQQHEMVENHLRVDKDVVLFKEYFKLTTRYEDMSPVIFPSGFTRDYLDGKVETQKLREKVLASFEAISSQNDFTIVEGTGHVGVGSIVRFNNADVAAALNLDLVLIARGGVGSAFDELALNKELCDQRGIKIRGVILNRVHHDKRDMVINYMTKALDRWKIPLIGCIPFNLLLSTPSMEDFETLFHTTLLSGEQFHYRHFETMRFVTSSFENLREWIVPNQLIIISATREDILEAVLQKNISTSEPEQGFILTGQQAPSSTIVEKLQYAQIPALYVNMSSYDIMKKITSFTAKIRKEDISKVEKAIQLVENYVNFDYLL